MTINTDQQSPENVLTSVSLLLNIQELHFCYFVGKVQLNCICLFNSELYITTESCETANGLVASSGFKEDSSRIFVQVDNMKQIIRNEVGVSYENA